MNETIRRREFFRKAALVTAGLFLITDAFAGPAPGEVSAGNGKPLLNPAFRMKEITSGEIELYTYLKDRKKLSELFGGLDAEIIREIVKGENPMEAAETLAFRHNLSYSECRLKIKQLTDELEHSGIIYYGEKMLVKIQEA